MPSSGSAGGQEGVYTVPGREIFTKQALDYSALLFVDVLLSAFPFRFLLALRTYSQFLFSVVVLAFHRIEHGFYTLDRASQALLDSKSGSCSEARAQNAQEM